MENHKHMRDQIYTTLRSRYDADPENLSTEQKAVLTLLSADRLLDMSEARERFRQVIRDQCDQAEEFVNRWETQDFKGANAHDAFFRILPMESADISKALGDMNTFARIVRINEKFVKIADEKEPLLTNSHYATPLEIEAEKDRIRQRGFTGSDEQLEREAISNAGFRKAFGDEELEKVLNYDITKKLEIPEE